VNAMTHETSICLLWFAEILASLDWASISDQLLINYAHNMRRNVRRFFDDGQIELSMILGKLLDKMIEEILRRNLSIDKK
jgi:hypothetical protein